MAEQGTDDAISCSTQGWRSATLMSAWGTGRLAPARFTILQRMHRDAKQDGKRRLGKPGPDPRVCDGGHFGPVRGRTPAVLHFAHRCRKHGAEIVGGCLHCCSPCRRPQKWELRRRFSYGQPTALPYLDQSMAGHRRFVQLCIYRVRPGRHRSACAIPRPCWLRNHQPNGFLRACDARLPRPCTRPPAAGTMNAGGKAG